MGPQRWKVQMLKDNQKESILDCGMQHAKENAPYVLKMKNSI